MKKFLGKAIVLLALFLALYCVMICIVFTAHTDAVCDAYRMELVKRQRLRSVPGRRIVLVGGSNLCYGVNSSELESATGLPVVNMGFNAGLGLCWQLCSAMEDLHKGDVVIVSPEYSNFRNGGSFWGEAQPIQVLADVLPTTYWPKFPPYFWAYHVPDIPVLFLSAIKRKVFHLGVHLVEPVENYNEQGDYIKNRRAMQPVSKIGLAGRLDRYDVDSSTVEEAVRLIEKIKDRTGVTPILLPPVYHDKSFENQKDFIDEISRKLSEVGYGFVSNCDRYKMNETLLYDSFWHLNARGVRVRMDLLIEDIKKCRIK